MHKEVQERFFKLITNQTPLFAEAGNPINTYKELIHYRFKEVILNAFPIFTEYLSPKEVESLIWEFIQSKPQTPFIWQMPGEFKTFVLQQNLEARFPFLENLLWFEYEEIELFMTHYTDTTPVAFDWNQPYVLSSSARVRLLNYPVYSDTIEEAGEYALILYYDFDELEVHFQEITPFMGTYLALLETYTPLEALSYIASEYDVDANEVKELLQAPLEQFCQLQILKEAP